MLDNYYRDADGVISQDRIGQLQRYDEQYIADRYHQYPDKCRQMAHLRLGYIIGAIGQVPNSILDVGYGSGEFVETAARIVPAVGGNDVTGIAPPANVTRVDNIFADYWQVITFFDVLEHLPDPRIIQHLRCSFIVISLPNCHYPSDEWFAKWRHRRPDEHLHHFNASALVNMFRGCGYDIVRWPCAIEDTIRGSLAGLPNIMTACFSKRI